MRSSGVYLKEDLDLTKELSDILKSDFSGKIGVLLFFIGVVRQEGLERKRVIRLEMESYEEHANRTIARICEEVKEKFKLEFVCIQHLLGEFHVGEPVVLVVVGGAKRENVFAAMEESVGRYKSEPALFKKEIYFDGSYDWIS